MKVVNESKLKQYNMALGIFGNFTLNINRLALSGTYMNWTTPGLEIEVGNKTVGLPDEFVGEYEN